MSGCLLGVAWCVADHADPLDDFDGHGSRFHRGERITFEVAQEPGEPTWDRDPGPAVRPVRWSDRSPELPMPVDDTRLQLCEWGPALTYAEVLALADWYRNLAEQLRDWQQVAVAP